MVLAMISSRAVGVVVGLTVACYQSFFWGLHLYYLASQSSHRCEVSCNSTLIVGAINSWWNRRLGVNCSSTINFIFLLDYRLISWWNRRCMELILALWILYLLFVLSVVCGTLRLSFHVIMLHSILLTPPKKKKKKYILTGNWLYWILDGR